MNALRNLIQHFNFTHLIQWITAILLILGEAIWVGLWYRTLLKTYDLASPDTELVLGGLMLLAYLLAQLVHAGRLVRPVSQGILLGMLLIILVLATHLLLSSQQINFLTGLAELSSFVVITLVIELWMTWRGVSMARDVIQPGMAWRRFILGLVFILANMFIINRFESGEADWGVFEAYLFVSLSAIILARISYAGVVHGLKKNPFNRYWLAITLGFVGAVILVTSLVAALFTGQFSALFNGLVGLLGWIGRIIMFIILLPGALLSLLILYVIQPLGPWLQRIFDIKLLQGEAIDMELAQPEIEQGTAFLSGIWPDLIRGIIFWGIILILLVLILKYFIKRKKSRPKVIELESESENLLEEGEARVLILHALRDAFQGLPGRFRAADPQSALAEIRKIYARLLVLGSELGIPRRPSQTPSEYLRDLKMTFVNQEKELEQITASYINLRYGESPESYEQVQLVTHAWEVVAREGKRLRTIRQALADKAEIQTSPPV